MAAALDLPSLPPTLRAVVDRVLATGDGHEEAIEALERHLAEGGERSADVLVALATLTYEDAAKVVLSRLREASEEALELLDEALAQDPDNAEQLRALRADIEASLRRERARERRLRTLMTDPSRARATEMVELAHRILMSGEDDGLAASLLSAAAEASERLPSVAPPPAPAEPEPPKATEAFDGAASGVFRTRDESR